MATTILATLWMAAWAGRGTPMGTMLHHVMIDAPARWLSRIARGHVLMAMLMFALIAGILWLMEGDGAMVIAFGWPEVAAFASVVDLPLLLDLAAVAMIAAGTVRIRIGVAWFAARIFRQRPRARRPKRSPRLRHAANDDEDRPSRAA